MTFKFTDLIYHKKKFLSDDECDLIISEYEQNKTEPINENAKHALTGEVVGSKFTKHEPRSGIWVDPITDEDTYVGCPAFNLIHKKVGDIVQEYQDYLDTFEAFHVGRYNFIRYPHTYRTLKYGVGGKIHPHIDHNEYTFASCTLNLNDDYTGGDFSFWFGKYKITLGKGDALIWPANGFIWVHEVEEITSGVRYATNCFIRDRPQAYPESINYNIRQLKEIDNEYS